MKNLNKNSCLVERFSHYIELNNEEKLLLCQLERKEITFKSRVKLQYQNLNSNLYVLKSGWLYQYIDTQDGGRRILRVFLPGELVGLDSFAMKSKAGEIMTASEVVICPFPDESIKAIFKQSPRLTQLLYSLGMSQEAMLLNRLKMMGRSSAFNSVANYMLEIHTRLKIHALDPNFKTFDMPLTQEVIGGILGLTNVTVSNAFSQLEQEGKIKYNRKTVTIFNPELLKQQLDFNDQAFAINTSWFSPDNKDDLYQLTA